MAISNTVYDEFSYIDEETVKSIEQIRMWEEAKGIKPMPLTTPNTSVSQTAANLQYEIEQHVQNQGGGMFIPRGGLTQHIAPLEKWLPQWARSNHGALLTVHYKQQDKSYVVRGEISNMRFVEVILSEEQLSRKSYAQFTRDTSEWIIANRLQDRVSRAESEMAENIPKKRIRMGKWGIKKAHIKSV